MGFTYPSPYHVYSATVPFNETVSYVPAPFRARQDADVENVLLYTDCEAPTPFGGDNVKLLEAITGSISIFLVFRYFYYCVFCIIYIVCLCIPFWYHFGQSGFSK